MYYKIIKQNCSLINNKWINNVGGKKLEVFDKYSGELLDKISYITADQMEDAISGSQKAFQELQRLSAEERKYLLIKIIKGLKAESMLFADLIAREAGKPIQYARAEVDRCISTLTFAAEEALKISGEMVPMDYGGGVGKTAYTKAIPIGPIIAISPFNFPLNLALHKIAPALALGCPIVLKPSPLAPLSVLAFAHLIKEAGFPAGSVNIIICENDLAESAVKDERFKMFSFTGSPKVGWHLKQVAHKKKVVLELGGNAAVIVDSTANLNEAAKAIAIGANLYAGQICISTQRVFVDKIVYEEFKEKLVYEIEQLKVGSILNEETQVGPLINKDHLKRVETWVQDAVKLGAKVLTGGKVESLENNIYQPTLLENVNHQSKVYCQEVFGPVSVIAPYENYTDAIKELNNSPFGLQAGVFTNRIDHMKIAHETIEVGGVMINNIPGFRVDTMPYGGVKDSGFGREGIRYTMEDMTEKRLIVL